MRRGTATVAALVMLMLVGVVTAALATRLADSAQRTHRATTDAQLRTALLSAAKLSADRLNAGQAVEREIVLPTAAGPVTVRIATLQRTAASTALSLRATGEAGRAEASVSYSLQDSEWRIETSELNGTAS